MLSAESMKSLGREVVLQHLHFLLSLISKPQTKLNNMFHIGRGETGIKLTVNSANQHDTLSPSVLF